MSTNSLGHTLEQSLNSAEAWIRQAEQQIAVAIAIAPNIGRLSSGEASSLLSVGYLKTTLLLLALAVENAFKAVKASKGLLEVDANGRAGKSLGAGRGTHRRP